MHMHIYLNVKIPCVWRRLLLNPPDMTDVLPVRGVLVHYIDRCITEEKWGGLHVPHPPNDTFVRVWNREIWCRLRYIMEIGSVNIKELVNCFHFQAMPLKRTWWLHNIAWPKYVTYGHSDPLPLTLWLLGSGKHFIQTQVRIIGGYTGIIGRTMSMKE